MVIEQHLRAAQQWLTTLPPAYQPISDRLAGLLHYLLDETGLAAEAFFRALAADPDDLLSCYYLLLVHESADDARQAAVQKQVLTHTVAYAKTGEMEPQALYYGGHIFRRCGMTEGAERCFGRSDDWLAANYMEVLVQAEGRPAESLEPLIRYLLKRESSHIAAGGAGFMEGDAPLCWQPLPTDPVEAILHEAQRREVAPAVALVKQWLEDHRQGGVTAAG